jgi:hypothetical protein
MPARAVRCIQYAGTCQVLLLGQVGYSPGADQG